MNILFIGDVVGRPGRLIFKESIQSLIKDNEIDVIIVNGENSAHGKGITSKIYQEFVKCGVDCITLGNHSFAKREILEAIDSCDRLIRPKNFEPENIGKSTKIIQTKEGSLAIHNVMGEVFMHKVTDNPFDTFETMLKEHPADMHFVDFHGEATAEKQTFFYRFNKDCIAIVGTHTHVTTADETIKNGCAYISDVGMTGVSESILGRDIQEVMDQLKGIKTHYKVASGPSHLSGVVIKVENKQATEIKRIKIS